MMRSLLDSGWLRRTLERWLPPRCAGTPGPTSLVQGALWSHRVRSCEHVLACHEGVVWLTCEGDATDYILTAGDTLRLEKPGLAVVQALQAARFELQELPRPSAVPHVLEGVTG